MRAPSRFAAVALAACTFSAGFSILTSILLRRWLRPRPALRTGFKPVTFFRPIKSGEPYLEADLSAFLQALEPGDQVLIGTHCENDLRTCEALIARFDLPDASCLRCVPGLHKNPKINKLVQMEPLARHDRWIILDSDTRPNRQFLRSFRSEWEAARANAISAPYGFTDCETLAARLDSLGTSLSLWPGVALLRATNRLDFLTGACMGIDAQFLRARGGWSVLGSSLADDHELGRLVLAAGGRIEIAATCISIRAGKMGWKEWALHQHRVFATYRLCNPSGSLGLPLTHGVAISFALALAKPRSAFRWAAHASLLALRVICANALPSSAPHLRHSPSSVWLVSILEPFFWLSSLLFPNVRWNGKWIRSEKIQKRL